MIYLDNNATTRLDLKVFAEIHPLMSEFVGNPSSIHQYGQRAKGILTDAMKRCALFFGVGLGEVIYTSGATEALNLLLLNIPKHGHVITSSLEHSAVIEPLKATGAWVTFLDPHPGAGQITAAQIEAAIQENTVMIVVNAANNETGIKNDIEAIAHVAAQAHIPLIVDGVASLGKEKFYLPKGVVAACYSGHKIHGPLGVGVAVVRRPFKLHPLIVGGGQQRGLRAGTENIPALVGLAKALELLDEKWVKHMEELRDRFEEGVLANLSDVIIHGKREARVCNTSNIAFLGVDGETLLMTLDLAGVAASFGSACSSGALASSRILLSMGVDTHVVRSSLRFSLSRFTTAAEIETSIALVTEAVSRLRKI